MSEVYGNKTMVNPCYLGMICGKDASHLSLGVHMKREHMGLEYMGL